ncbi:Tfp pilus assembly protein PilP [Methylocaldum marinum]|uniref:Tfp pilus assembly protein PilP n=1 Tax=Methylocaldum marinum TaxID=1432792 RepID=A0A250L028_9GAMM|nr:Tfp pilus assembly protein PilP [Methylocaldum marinum]
MGGHLKHLVLPCRSRLLVSWLVALGISGCAGNDLTDLEAYVAEVKARQKGSVEPLPEIKTVEPFVFNPEDLRDPFIIDDNVQETVEARIGNGIRPDIKRPKEELESYELDTLRMVGTVNRHGVLWGLVKAGDGTIHRVRAGNHMGKNFGKIVNIKESIIELVEIISESPGAWRERKAALDLAEVGGKK